MSSRNTNVEPAFSLTPRGDLNEQTLDYLRNFFRTNPNDTLTVTTTITRNTLRDYERNKRASLATFRGFPKKRRAVTSEE